MGEANHTGAVGNSAPGPGYETRDANTGAVLGFLAFLFLVLVLMLFGTFELFRHYFTVSQQQPAPASAFAGVRQVPSEPELAVNGREDLLKIEAKQEQELEAYSWEDRKSGMVRIPIERAMDLLLQKGLPVLPSAASETKSGGSVTEHPDTVRRGAGEER